MYVRVGKISVRYFQLKKEREKRKKVTSTIQVKLMVLPALIKSSEFRPLRPSIRVTGSEKHKKKQENIEKFCLLV
jgi:hypothetical protein